MPTGLMLRVSNCWKSTLLNRVNIQIRRATAVLEYLGLVLVGTWIDCIRELGKPSLVYDNLVDLKEVRDQTPISSSSGI